MENAVDALIMAASVLLLIIALSVSISSFSSLKNQIDEILQIEEETDLAIDENGNYINYVEGAEMIRTVSADTVISSIRRIMKEEYTVIISGSCITDNINSGLQDFSDAGIIEKLGTDQILEENDDGNTTSISKDTYVFKLSIDSNYATYITNENIETLYKVIKNYEFDEYLGIWQYDSNVSDANKETYRIVTFVQT